MVKFEKFSKEKMGTPGKAYDILMEELERISIDDFEDLYGKENAGADRDHVQNLQKKFEEENTPTEKEAKRYSDMLEALFTDLAEKGRWLGNGALIYNSSEYDDLVNGVDMIAEFMREGMFSHLGLAIDVTFSKDVRSKLRRIRREIESGELAKIKYYNSPRAHIRGELNNIPHVIVGAEKTTIDELINLWFQRRKLSETLQNRQLEQSVQEASQRQLRQTIEQLKNHKLQFIILKQIEYQLEQYANFAKSTNKKGVVEKLESALDTIRRVTADKEFPENSDKFLEILEEEIKNIFEKREYGL